MSTGASKSAILERPVRVGDIYMQPRGRPDWKVFIPRPLPVLARAQLTVPVAPSAAPTDADVFESADGSKRYVLPRYALAFDKVGSIEEPRIAIADRSGTPTLVVTLSETPSAASASGATELEHIIAVTLKYRVPVISGGEVVQSFPFSSVSLDSVGTTVTAELPLTTPGQHQQIVAALASREASATLVVGRGITVGVMTGEALPDGNPGYRVRKLLLEWTAPPASIVLSETQRDRLGGASGGMQPLIRHRFAFDGVNHSYWQDPARPEHFYFLPDRFLLARAADGNRAPLLRVRGAAVTGDEEPRLAFEFQARPVVNHARIDAAQPQLEQKAKERGATGALALEIMPDPQPLLRLALAENGAPSSNMTERPGADIDLETGLAHVETMHVEDFKLIYDALFGASSTLLHGEVRAATKGGDPEDIPLDLRIDKTVGDVLSATAGQDTVEGYFTYRLTNAIESPVRIDRLAATVAIGDQRYALPIQNLTAGLRLAPNQSVDIVLTNLGLPPIQRPLAPEAIVFDQTGVAVEPDAKALWDSILDKSAAAQLTREVNVTAAPAFFTSSDVPNDRVAFFVVTVENGESVKLTEAKLEDHITVRVPIEPLITGAKVPPIRYRTETWWGSGALGVSELRDVDGTILVPVKTAPPATSAPKA